MKRWQLPLCLGLCFVLIGLSISCAGSVDIDKDADYTIKVWGPSGQEFSGSYMVITSSGQTTSRSVDGIVPKEYTVRGNIVSCAFQKMSAGGYLNMEIIKDGKVVACSGTTAAYGMVIIATP